MDYTGVYEDILAMEHRTHAAGYDGEPDIVAVQQFLNECIQFRRDILLQTRAMFGWITV